MIKEQMKLEGEESNQYKYMKENMMRILIQSLCIYCKKGGILNVEPFFYELQENNLSKQNLNRIFSDSVLCDEILNFVKNKFDDNIPEGNFEPLFFKQCWEDYSHFQQRMIDKQPSNRQDLTLYTCTRILRQIQKSSVIIKYDLVEQKDLIRKLNQEDYKLRINSQSDNHKSNLKELKEMKNYLLSKQNINSQSTASIQSLIIPKEIKKNYNKINYQYQEKLFFTQIKNKQKIRDILAQIIHDDLQKQIIDEFDLNQILIDFYQYLHNQFILSKYFKCSKDKIFQLYLSDIGRDYLQQYVEDGKIIKYLMGRKNIINKQRKKWLSLKTIQIKNYIDSDSTKNIIIISFFIDIHLKIQLFNIQNQNQYQVGVILNQKFYLFFIIFVKQNQ
ncbi:hypothetical protein pb186bvf_015306 [Paramecium bursaria]